MRAQRIFLLLIVLSACTRDDGPLPPPHFGPLDRQPSSTWNVKPATGISLGSLRVVFERTDLVTVRNVAGTGLIDGDASEEWLCYMIAGSPPTRLWIVSRGQITGVTAVRQARGVGATKHCPLLPISLSPVAFDQGVAVGMRSAEVAAKLGDPSMKWKDWWVYHHASTVFSGVPGASVGMPIVSTLYVRIKDGAADAIVASLRSSF